MPPQPDQQPRPAVVCACTADRLWALDRALILGAAAPARPWFRGYLAGLVLGSFLASVPLTWTLQQERAKSAALVKFANDILSKTNEVMGTCLSALEEQKQITRQCQGRVS